MRPFNPMMPRGRGIYPGMGPSYPYQEMLGAENGTLSALIAQILMQKRAMDAEQQERVADKVATFDPNTVYQRYGAGIPRVSGLSAMARYRDMAMRNAATAAAGKAAVAAKQREQAEAIQPGTAADLATSNIVKEVVPRVGGGETEFLSSKYGTGNNSPNVRRKFFTGAGDDIGEFFQRAVNSEAGSPNAAALGLAPEPGYRGVPMDAGNEELWRQTMRRHDARRVRK